LTWNGSEPIAVAGEDRTWLQDGDEVTISATAGDVTLGEVTGRIQAADGTSGGDGDEL